MKSKSSDCFWWQTDFACRLRDLFQRRVFWPVLKQYCKSHEVTGLENLAQLDHPVIFVANHASHADTVMILSALPPHLRRKVTVAAAQDYFYSKCLRAFVVSLFLNTFPFDRHDGARSLEQCEAEIQQGWSLLIYPEGTRSTDGSIGRFKKGVAALAKRLNVPVVPVYIEGCSQILPKGCSHPQKTDIRVRFGAPVRYDNAASLAAIATDMRRRVVELKESCCLSDCA